MPELGTYGSAPGAPSNGRPYGDPRPGPKQTLINGSLWPERACQLRGLDVRVRLIAG